MPHRLHLDEVENHHGYHQQHYQSGHRRLVVQRYPGSLFHRLPEYHPVGILAAQTAYVLPCTLHQEHVPAVKLLLAQVMQDIILLAADTQDVDIELVPESGILDRPSDDGGGRHKDYLSDTYIVEIQCIAGIRRGRGTGRHLRRMAVHHLQEKVIGETADILRLS